MSAASQKLQTERRAKGLCRDCGIPAPLHASGSRKGQPKAQCETHAQIHREEVSRNRSILNERTELLQARVGVLVVQRDALDAKIVELNREIKRRGEG